MSTNSSSQALNKKLSEKILDEFNQISSEFTTFQTENGLTCFEGCGKCCIKPDIYCTPIELLPLVLDLLERGEAQTVYEKCLNLKSDLCFFLEVHDKSQGLGKCTEYKFRPLVCRTFGVAARKGKNDNIDFSICKPIKEGRSINYQELTLKKNIPFIDLCKNRLTTLSPLFMEEEFPINQSLQIMLEKILLLASYTDDFNEEP